MPGVRGTSLGNWGPWGRAKRPADGVSDERQPQAGQAPGPQPRFTATQPMRHLTAAPDPDPEVIHRRRIAAQAQEWQQHPQPRPRMTGRHRTPDGNIDMTRLPPATPMRFSPDPAKRREQVRAAGVRVEAAPYPDCADQRDAYGHAVDYAALSRYYDRIFGAVSPWGNPAAWPLPKLPDTPRSGKPPRFPGPAVLGAPDVFDVPWNGLAITSGGPR